LIALSAFVSSAAGPIQSRIRSPSATGVIATTPAETSETSTSGTGTFGVSGAFGAGTAAKPG
jgi:hypothetical protein